MKYYFLTTDIFPSEIANSESIILIQDEESDSEVRADDLEFISTLVLNTDDVEESLLHIQDWWSESTSGKLELELITDNVSALSADQKKLASRLQLGQWSVKDNFLAFPKGNKECLDQAKSIIIESEISAQ